MRSPWSVLGSLLPSSLLLLGLGSSPAGAQIIKVPPFQVASGIVAGNLGVAVATDGTLLFSWLRTPPNSRELYTRAYTPAGVALGPAVRVDSDGTVQTFDLAAAAGGGYTVGSIHRGVDMQYDLFGFALDAAGVTPGPEHYVNTSSSNGIYGANVAALPSGGSVFAWTRSVIFLNTVTEVTARVFNAAGQPLGPQFKVGADGVDGRDVAALSDGGFAVCWQDNVNNFGTIIRTFDGNGTARGPQHATAFAGLVRHVTGHPSDGTGTLLTTTADLKYLGARLFAADGTFVGNGVTITTDNRGVDFDLEYASSGHLLAAWTGFDDDTGDERVRARVFDGSFGPVLEPFWVGTQSADAVRLAKTTDPDTFVVAWQNGTAAWGAVVELCTPAHSVCGDGTLTTACAEVCDDGAGNSDVLPDACRNDCQPARCGDGVIDSGEACDDGNIDPCDGCDSICAVELGLVCGDGIPNPACGESCDDANAIDGDGCRADCVAERAFGGGSPKVDCGIEWQIDNPSNLPRYLDDGINPIQTCTDNDTACDFDGGVTGSCTFHVAVCALNTNIESCNPPGRLASWTLAKPSAHQAERNASYANVRAALLGSVPGAIVGPTINDLCSPFTSIEVPLRGSPGAYKRGRLTLKAEAQAYFGFKKDTDQLKLFCLP